MIITSDMKINDMVATFNTPPALEGESLNSLPPYARCMAYPVDEYLACPKTWMHGAAKASSYFVPVKVGRGMWFDFTQNAFHSHDVAVVTSVQGINPITGQKVTTLNLEQYKENCPKHDVPFQQDRYCPKCEYKWPAQNYLATTTRFKLWIDGFRNEKGEVRQYIITEDETRGVAAQLIGEDRVWAIGFAFYQSKEKKKRIEFIGGLSTTGGGGGDLIKHQVAPPWDYTGGNVNVNYKYATSSGHIDIVNNSSLDVYNMGDAAAGEVKTSAGIQGFASDAKPSAPMMKKKSKGGISGQSVSRGMESTPEEVSVKHLEIAAGA